MKIVTTDIFKTQKKRRSDIDIYLESLKFIKTDKDLNHYRDFLINNVGGVIKSDINTKKILLRGDVQSGKTNNIIFLINELIERKHTKLFLYTTGRLNDLNSQNLKRIKSAFSMMDKSVETFNAKGNNTNYKNIGKLLEKNDAVIISGIKRTEFIKSFSLSCKSLGIDNPVFIDDESDDVSLSNKFHSTVNEFIVNNKNAKYIQITATPYKNLYNFQPFYDLYTNFKSPSSYTGLEDFFGKYKPLISSKDSSRYFQPLLHFATTAISLNLSRAEMLVSVTDSNSFQKETQKSIMENIELLKFYIRRKDLAICNAIRKKGVKPEVVFDFLTKLYGSVYIYNGDGRNSDELYREKIKRSNIKIIIGGIALSRGITFEDLITQVMIKQSESDKFNAGDIMQRSRWFGHRNLVNHMKIYMNTSLISAYDEMKDLDNMVKDFKLDDNFKKEFENLKLEKIADPIYEKEKDAI